MGPDPYFITYFYNTKIDKERCTDSLINHLSCVFCSASSERVGGVHRLYPGGVHVLVCTVPGAEGGVGMGGEQEASASACRGALSSSPTAPRREHLQVPQGALQCQVSPGQVENDKQCQQEYI